MQAATGGCVKISALLLQCTRETVVKACKDLSGLWHVREGYTKSGRENSWPAFVVGTGMRKLNIKFSLK